MSQLGTITAETVGNQNIGTGRSIFGMDAGHCIRRNPIHLFWAASRRQATFLKQGAHSAIENQYPFCDRFTKICHSLLSTFTLPMREGWSFPSWYLFLFHQAVLFH
jgi:hypothetical protein